MAIVSDLSGNANAGIADRAYITHTRTNAGTPLAAVTPNFVGEVILDTTNGKRYRAVTLLNSGWVEVIGASGIFT